MVYLEAEKQASKQAGKLASEQVEGWNGLTTALTVYSTNTNDTTISTARTLVTGTGAASTNAFTSKCGTSTGYWPVGSFLTKKYNVPDNYG